MLDNGSGTSAPLEVRLQYLRRRRRDPWRTLGSAAIVVAIVWTVLIGLGLFLH
jgi:hypothetical protein